MTKKIIYIKKTSEFFTYNKIYKIEKIDSQKKELIIKNDLDSFHILTKKFFIENWKYKGLNEELQDIINTKEHLELILLKTRIIEIERANLWLSVALIIQLSIIAYLIFKVSTA